MAHEPHCQKTNHQKANYRLLQVHAVAAARSMQLQQHKIGFSFAFISAARITGIMQLKDKLVATVIEPNLAQVLV
jgi:hypothetical protein